MTDQASGHVLLGDVGGTHTRIAVLDEGAALRHVDVIDNGQFPDLLAVLDTYMRDRAAALAPIRRAVLAVASPVTGDELHLTNLDWRISVSRLKAALALRELRVVNDFAALARAVPVIPAEHLIAIGDGTRDAAAPLGVIGPGTGLGVAAAVPAGRGWKVVAGEGGHASLSAADPVETQIIERLRARFGHASAERALSGPGLLNLYEALGGDAAGRQPPELTAAALSGSDPLAVRMLDLFFALLGGTAGNLALTVGARGGIFLGGGILPRLIEPLRASAFRERFVAKGRFRGYLAAIATFVIDHPHPALLGLAEFASGP